MTFTTKINDLSISFLSQKEKEEYFNEIKSVLSKPELRTLLEIIKFLKHFEKPNSPDFLDLVNKFQLCILGYSVNTNFDEINDVEKNLLNDYINILSKIIKFLLSIATLIEFFGEVIDDQVSINDLRRMTIKMNEAENEIISVNDYVSNNTNTSNEKNLKFDTLSFSQSKVKKKKDGSDKVFFEIYKMLDKVYKKKGGKRDSVSSSESDASLKFTNNLSNIKLDNSVVSDKKELLMMLQKMMKKNGLSTKSSIKGKPVPRKMSLFNKSSTFLEESENTDKNRRSSDSISLISDYFKGFPSFC